MQENINEIKQNKFLSPQIISRRLDVSERTVIRLITDGKIKGHKIGKLWRISEESFQKYIEQTVFKSSNN